MVALTDMEEDGAGGQWAECDGSRDNILGCYEVRELDSHIPALKGWEFCLVLPLLGLVPSI